MSEALFSDIWYRIADLKLSLRAEIRVHRHRYRGQLWYIVQDTASGQYHRLSAPAYAFIGLLDGRLSVDEAWQASIDQLGDDAPSQPQIINLLAKLYGIDVLKGNFTPNALELFQRARRVRRERWLGGLLSPLAWRLPLFAPRSLLDWLLPLVKLFRGLPGWLLWLIVVIPALVQTWLHWDELTHDVLSRVLAPHNLLIMALIYPVIKALHEIAHGLSTRIRGGEVHEAGVMFLVFIPVPYIDASAASTFPRKRDRMAVGAAGVAVELFVASLALFVWLAVEPGLVRLIAYDTMLIGGVSTLLFNGNPLMRFDSYYVLADAIEIPNLAKRSGRYYLYLLQRYLFGNRQSTSPVGAPGERHWFLGYGFASLGYRLFITSVIVLGLAEHSILLGAIVGLWAFFSVILLPLGKGIMFVLDSPALAQTRARAVVSTVAIAALLAAAVLLVPTPVHTRAEGVVRVPEYAWIRAGAEGLATGVQVHHGDRVTKNQVLAVLDNPVLEAEVRRLSAYVRELEAQLAAVMHRDLVKANMLRNDIATARSDLEVATHKRAQLTIRAPVSGRYLYAGVVDFPGRFFVRGDLIGYVLENSAPTVRVVVDQEDVALVRDATLGVEVKLASQIRQIIPAMVSRQVPSADHELPSPSLGLSGGGRIAVDPTDQKGTTSLESSFKFDLRLPIQKTHPPLGSRAYVRFDHGYETLGSRWYRTVRQLLLTRLAV